MLTDSQRFFLTYGSISGPGSRRFFSSEKSTMGCAWQRLMSTSMTGSL